jgi:phosphatidate cytidylyltransferase
MNHIAKRTVSALATAAVVVCALIYLPLSAVLPAVIALVALVHLEFLQMLSRRHETMIWQGLTMGAALLTAVAYRGSVGKAAAIVMTAAFLSTWAAALFGRFKTALAAMGTTLLGVVYIPFLLAFFVKIPLEYGITMLLYVISIVKISDMGGFAFGVAFGKHKMCPSISPGKSWEGLAGSVFASMVISLAFMPLTHFGLAKSLALGAAAAIVGTFGDLVESRFKRECGVKDSATFMPAGLGGFLDMFDSLVFAPAVLYPFLAA